jgi:hypothetical protein
MILITFILIIVLKALTDALFYLKMKRISKWVEESWLIILTCFAWTHNRQSDNEYIHVIMIYLFLRAALFDTLFNLFAKLPIFHKGSTSEWDDFMKRFKAWQYIILKLFFLSLGILVYLRKFI